MAHVIGKKSGMGSHSCHSFILNFTLIASCGILHRVEIIDICVKACDLYFSHMN